jgi:hypothetical protein
MLGQGRVMLLVLARLPALLGLLVAPALGQTAPPPLSVQERAAQNLAIATSVQEQLLACWMLPAGYADKLVSVRLAFWGDGSLDGEPSIDPGSLRTAGQYPVLMQSIGQAVERCLPFEGLEALGAGASERFDITVHFQS